MIEEQVGELKEQVIKVNRVAKVVKGGKRFSFRAVVAVGDQRGQVGVGLGKAAEVPDCIKKATESAKKNLIRVPLKGTTIPHEIKTKHGAAIVLMKPASAGTGVIAGGAVRVIVQLAGIKDILTKSLGSKNAVNTSYATLKCLKQLRSVEQVAQTRNKKVEEIIGETRNQ